MKYSEVSKYEDHLEKLKPYQQATFSSLNEHKQFILKQSKTRHLYEDVRQSMRVVKIQKCILHLHEHSDDEAQLDEVLESFKKKQSSRISQQQSIYQRYSCKIMPEKNSAHIHEHIVLKYEVFDKRYQQKYNFRTSMHSLLQKYKRNNLILLSEDQFEEKFVLNRQKLTQEFLHSNQIKLLCDEIQLEQIILQELRKKKETTNFVQQIDYSQSLYKILEQIQHFSDQCSSVNDFFVVCKILNKIDSHHKVNIKKVMQSVLKEYSQQSGLHKIMGCMARSEKIRSKTKYLAYFRYPVKKMQQEIQVRYRREILQINSEYNKLTVLYRAAYINEKQLQQAIIQDQCDLNQSIEKIQKVFDQKKDRKVISNNFFMCASKKQKVAEAFLNFQDRNVVFIIKGLERLKPVNKSRHLFGSGYYLSFLHTAIFDQQQQVLINVKNLFHVESLNIREQQGKKIYQIQLVLLEVLNSNRIFENIRTTEIDLVLRLHQYFKECKNFKQQILYQYLYIDQISLNGNRKKKLCRNRQQNRRYRRLIQNGMNVYTPNLTEVFSESFYNRVESALSQKWYLVSIQKGIVLTEQADKLETKDKKSQLQVLIDASNHDSQPQWLKIDQLVFFACRIIVDIQSGYQKFPIKHVKMRNIIIRQSIKISLLKNITAVICQINQKNIKKHKSNFGQFYYCADNLQLKILDIYSSKYRYGFDYETDRIICNLLLTEEKKYFCQAKKILFWWNKLFATVFQIKNQFKNQRLKSLKEGFQKQNSIQFDIFFSQFSKSFPSIGLQKFLEYLAIPQQELLTTLMKLIVQIARWNEFDRSAKIAAQDAKFQQKCISLKKQRLYHSLQCFDLDFTSSYFQQIDRMKKQFEFIDNSKILQLFGGNQKSQIQFSKQQQKNFNDNQSLDDQKVQSQNQQFLYIRMIVDFLIKRNNAEFRFVFPKSSSYIILATKINQAIKRFQQILISTEDNVSLNRQQLQKGNLILTNLICSDPTFFDHNYLLPVIYFILAQISLLLDIHYKPLILFERVQYLCEGKYHYVYSDLKKEISFHKCNIFLKLNDHRSGLQQLSELYRFQKKLHRQFLDTQNADYKKIIKKTRKKIKEQESYHFDQYSQKSISYNGMPDKKKLNQYLRLKSKVLKYIQISGRFIEIGGKNSLIQILIAYKSEPETCLCQFLYQQRIKSQTKLLKKSIKVYKFLKMDYQQSFYSLILLSPFTEHQLNSFRKSSLHMLSEKISTDNRNALDQSQVENSTQFKQSFSKEVKMNPLQTSEQMTKILSKLDKSYQQSIQKQRNFSKRDFLFKQFFTKYTKSLFNQESQLGQDYFETQYQPLKQYQEQMRSINKKVSSWLLSQ